MNEKQKVEFTSPEIATIYNSPSVSRLREQLAIALRAAAIHGLAEGVCNHFSIALPDDTDKFLLNPRGLMWSEIYAEDILLVDGNGYRLAGAHDVEPSAMFIHAAMHRVTKKQVVLHSHAPFATTLTLTEECCLDTKLSQNAMRFHGRTKSDPVFNGLALDHAEGERIANATLGADIIFLANHGVIVCGDRIDYVYDDLYYLERACQLEVQARSMGVNLRSVNPDLTNVTANQLHGERLQSELFFQALERTVK